MAVVGMAATPLVPTKPAAIRPAKLWKRARHVGGAGHVFSASRRSTSASSLPR
jgi:hypothetical protein